jgi:hypothetical protein
LEARPRIDIPQRFRYNALPGTLGTPCGRERIRFMKKYVSAPLCSALIIPGLGQIINQDVKKGLVLLATVFILIILGGVKLYILFESAFREAASQGLTAQSILYQLRASDFTALWILVGLFGATWLYAVTDAFLRGRRLESKTGDASS